MVDAQAAKKLCTALGLQHTLYHIPDSNEEIRDFELIKMILAHNTSYFVNLADNEIRKYIFLHDLDAYDNSGYVMEEEKEDFKILMEDDEDEPTD